MYHRGTLEPGKTLGTGALQGRLHADVIAGKQGAEPGYGATGKLRTNYPEFCLVGQVLFGLGTHFGGHVHALDVIRNIHLGDLSDNDVFVLDLGLTRLDTRRLFECNSDLRSRFGYDPVDQVGAYHQCHQRYNPYWRKAGAPRYPFHGRRGLLPAIRFFTIVFVRVVHSLPVCPRSAARRRTLRRAW